jgi:hypothetical protein
MTYVLHTFYVHDYWATHAFVHEPVSCANAVGSTVMIEKNLYKTPSTVTHLQRHHIKRNLIGETS